MRGRELRTSKEARRRREREVRGRREMEEGWRERKARRTSSTIALERLPKEEIVEVVGKEEKGAGERGELKKMEKRRRRRQRRRRGGGGCGGEKEGGRGEERRRRSALPLAIIAQMARSSK